jgi:hypothetical protein
MVVFGGYWGKQFGAVIDDELRGYPHQINIIRVAASSKLAKPKGNRIDRLPTSIPLVALQHPATNFLVDE